MFVLPVLGKIFFYAFLPERGVSLEPVVMDAVGMDSYGNALTPYFMDSFEDIYVIDMRYFKPNAISFMKEHNVTDVLFAMNTFSATGPNAKKIEQIRTQ